jgi:2-polyprenyl-6-methoxyphenol hydroxylase-like FAD-dependent oxidoreductase
MAAFVRAHKRLKPVMARVPRQTAEGQIETLRAGFVVGCDGAHSIVRRSLGRALHGDLANQAWGVMDVLAITDFPDIRIKAAIHSANDGSVLIIRGKAASLGTPRT